MKRISCMNVVCGVGCFMWLIKRVLFSECHRAEFESVFHPLSTSLLMICGQCLGLILSLQTYVRHAHQRTFSWEISLQYYQSLFWWRVITLFISREPTGSRRDAQQATAPVYLKPLMFRVSVTVQERDKYSSRTFSFLLFSSLFKHLSWVQKPE